MLFTDYRIDRSTVSTGILTYDIHTSDGAENDFATLELCIMANHTGTVLVKHHIPMPDGYRAVRADARRRLSYDSRRCQVFRLGVSNSPQRAGCNDQASVTGTG